MSGTSRQQLHKTRLSTAVHAQLVGGDGASFPYWFFTILKDAAESHNSRLPLVVWFARENGMASTVHSSYGTGYPSLGTL